MEAALLDLSQRVEKLEQEFIVIRKELEERLRPRKPLTPAERGALLIERAKRNAVRDSQRFGQIFDEMGIPRDPAITRKKVQQMYIEAGFDAEVNDFAQGIVAMREE